MWQKLFPITSTFLVVTKHSHLCENQMPFFIRIKIGYEFSSKEQKGTKTLGQWEPKVAPCFN